VLTAKPTRTNLTPLQREIITTIKNNDNIIIALADKGLSPVGVDIEQYIEWGLQHLHDRTTYSLLSEQAAQQASQDLFQQIYTWTLTHRKTLGDETVTYI